MKLLFQLFTLVVSITSIVIFATSADLTPVSCCISGNAYYDGSYKFCNLLKQGSAWGVPGGPWKGSAKYSNDTGYPIEDFSIIIQSQNRDEAIDGNFLIKGVGYASTLTISPTASACQLSNFTIDSTTYNFSASLYCPPNNNDDQIILSFTNTNGGVSYLGVFQPGCSGEDSEIFTPNFINAVSRCSILRFMDFTATNNNNISNWSDRNTMNWPIWSGEISTYPGAPWEAAIALASVTNNGNGRDIWINIPISANDDYITSLANLLLNAYTTSILPPTTNIYVEYSNEIWNWMFQQAHTNLNYANYSVLYDNDPYHFNYDLSNNTYYYGYRRIAYMSGVHIPSIFASVFGADKVGKNKQIRPIFASQIAYTFLAELGLDYLDTIYPGIIEQNLHALAGVPYFNLGLPAANVSDNFTVNDILSLSNTSIQNMAPTTGWSGDKAIAAYNTLASYYGLYVHGYEGGPDYSESNKALQAKGDAQRDPRFSSLVVSYLYNSWYSFGAAEDLNWYTGGASDFYTQYGCWGLLEDIRNQTSMKTIGFDQVRNTVRANNSFGILLPTSTNSVFSPFPATNFSGYNSKQTPFPSALQYFGLNSSWLYPLNVNPMYVMTPNNQLNITVYTATNGQQSNNGNQIAVSIRAGNIRKAIITVPTGGNVPTTSTASSPPVGTSVLLPLLPTYDGQSRGLVSLQLQATGTSTSYAIVWIDINVVPSPS